MKYVCKIDCSQIIMCASPSEIASLFLWSYATLSIFIVCLQLAQPPKKKYTTICLISKLSAVITVSKHTITFSFECNVSGERKNGGRVEKKNCQMNSTKRRVDDEHNVKC